MKKVYLIIAALGLFSAVYAHHPSPSDTAGGNMSDSLGHLTNSLPAGLF